MGALAHPRPGAETVGLRVRGGSWFRGSSLASARTRGLDERSRVKVNKFGEQLLTVRWRRP
jgi:hypothetical protein